MAVVIKPSKTTVSTPQALTDLTKHIYNDDEIKLFRMDEAINDHPLKHRPTNIRSKLAYKELMHNCNTTSKYLLPGQICIFNYSEPKYKEELEYYDKTPFVLYFGLTRTKDGNIREVGINMHYFPPHTRARILNTSYEVFKNYFKQQFNDPIHKPNRFIDYPKLKALMSRYNKIAFGVKMYIPVLRGNSYVIPTRLLPTACYTEGHFSKATLQQIFRFWRQFK